MIYASRKELSLVRYCILFFIQRRVLHGITSILPILLRLYKIELAFSFLIAVVSLYQSVAQQGSE